IILKAQLFLMHVFNLGVTALPVALTAFPTPFKGSTTFHYKLAQDAASVRIDIVDGVGRRIVTIDEGSKPAGDYYIPWTRVNLAAGTYYARLTADGNKSVSVGIVKLN
ncbi:MAG: FlgD immunoglobulin-like domain containing protein, partial [Ferruginibacter sp.]